jgi:haloacetate dehalogenase
MDGFDGFEAAHHDVGGLRLFVRTGGAAPAPPVLLLHGFPQTHAMWRRVARLLGPHFQLVMPDLRGYGDSDKPAAAPDHGDYSKRTMASDMAWLMRSLGHERYFVAGHDRGGRVAHRLALDHPGAVHKLALIDIAPTLDMYDRSDKDFAAAYYHWYMLIQPHPLPERLIGGNARFYLHWTLGGWGANGIDHVEPHALAEYERCFCTPHAIHAACEDYRAAATIDLVHDRASRAAGHRIACDTLVMWGERGIVHRFFDPVALWQAQCSTRVAGRLCVGAGHFIPEEQPEETAAALREFFEAG